MAAAERRQFQKEETKRLIKETAYYLFEKNGYEETTMRSLANAAGVGLGTIFSHFPDKSSLLAAAMLEDVNQTVENAFNSLPEQGIIRQLEHIVRELYKYYAQRPNLTRIILSRLLFFQGSRNRDLEEQLFDFLIKIESLFITARQNGEIPDDGDINLYTQAFASFYLACLHAGLSGPCFDVNLQVAAFNSLAEHFLLKRK